MGKSAAQKAAERNNLAIQASQLEEMRRANAHREALFSMLQPFGSEALDFGRSALAGKVPNQFLLPIENSISDSFGQGRQNLAEALGRTGQSGSGISAGPLANMEADQARASGDARMQALLAAFGIGVQGGNLLTGQESIFDPNQYANSATGAGGTILGEPRSGVGGAIAGGAASAGTAAILAF